MCNITADLSRCVLGLSNAVEVRAGGEAGSRLLQSRRTMSVKVVGL
jgi:hypothetical protein